MRRRMIVNLILSGFILLGLACFSMRSVGVNALTGPGAEEIKIRKVETRPGESVEFSRENPGRIRGGYIEGVGTWAFSLRTLEIPSSEIKTVIQLNETDQTVKLRDGRSFGPVKKIIKQGGKSILFIAEAAGPGMRSSFHIPLSEVRKTWDKRMDWLGTFAVVLGGVLFLRTITWSSDEVFYKNLFSPRH
jgi:hypothetical protein